MKLYATVSSERASKGQGGNNYLDIEVRGDKQQPIARMVIEQGELGPTLEIIYSKNEFEAPIITRIKGENKLEDITREACGMCGKPKNKTGYCPFCRF